MTSGSVARRYAKALLQIGVDKQTYDTLGRELDRAAEAFERSPELRAMLGNPLFPIDKRRNVLQEMAHRLALSPTIRNFLMLLLDKGRLTGLGAIARAHRELLDQHAGRLRAKITTAGPLDPTLETRLKDAIEKATGRSVLLEKSQDPSLVGGVVTQVGDMVYDGSLRTQLENLRTELLTTSP